MLRHRRDAGVYHRREVADHASASHLRLGDGPFGKPLLHLRTKRLRDRETVLDPKLWWLYLAM